MKRQSFWEFIQRENNDLCKILIWIISFPLRLLRRILLASLVAVILFYFGFVLPIAVARLAVVYHAFH